MIRSILAFLGFGRSARLARMVRKAHERTLRAYGPAFGFFPDNIRRFNPEGWMQDEGDAGNVRYRRAGLAGCIPSSNVPPYRKGWGIVPTFRTAFPNPEV